MDTISIVTVPFALVGVWYVLKPTLYHIKDRLRAAHIQKRIDAHEKENAFRTLSDIANLNTSLLIQLQESVNKLAEPRQDDTAEVYLQALAGLAGANTHLLENQQKVEKLLEAIVVLLKGTNK